MSTSTNKKATKTPLTRQSQFPDDVKAMGTTLMCIYCNHEIDWVRKSSVKSHIGTNKHIEIKMNSIGVKRQATLQQTAQTIDKKQEMIFDFIEMMIECNIPLEKKDKMNDWLQKYVPNAGFIPSGYTLRRNYLPKVLEKHRNEIKEKIKDQPLAIMIDSSPDRLGRNVVNTIVVCGISGERFLLDTTFLKSVDNVTLFQTIDKVRVNYGLAWDNISTLVTDSASYNKKLYNVIKEGINPKIKFIRCWAHLIDLVSDVWQDSTLNSKVHFLTAKFQELMNKSSLRKSRYLEFLAKKNALHVKGMPSIVLSRWNTWFYAMEYLKDFVMYIREFIKDEKRNQESSAIVDTLSNLLENDANFFEIQLMAHFYYEHARQFHDLIEEFEHSLGVVHTAFNRIKNLWNSLRFNAFYMDFGESIHNFITQNNMDEQYWIGEFKLLYRNAWKRLDSIMKEHEGLEFLKAVRVFDPSQLPHVSKSAEDYKAALPDLNLEDSKIERQFKAYLSSDMEITEINPIEFWKTMSPNCPELSRIAIAYLNTPVSSVDVERSFSLYRDILTDKRTRLKLSSLSALCMISYNSNFNDEMNELF